jgi:hypothetical protein
VLVRECCRFSRPIDDHARSSELNDDDEESDSETDVFVDESQVKSTTNVTALIAMPSSVCGQTHHSNGKLAAERRWHWSKESGGLIDKGNRRNKSTPVRPNDIMSDDSNYEHVEHNIELNEPTAISTCKHHILQRKQSFQIPTIMENDLLQYESNPNTDILPQYSSTSADQHDEQPAMESIFRSTSMTNDFFDNGPLTDPEETMIKLTTSN